ncbi:hypothetical protein Trydic_g22979 [Trypoxylus dichotomus]
MYGLLKIHKQDVPLRSIVTSMESPTQTLARYLANQLKPYGEQIISYVKNVDYFIDILHQPHVEITDMLVIDVTSLFTQAPIKETVDIVRNKHQVEDHLINLIEHCLKNIYFTYNGQRYRQTEGAPMGLLLSPIANIFMEDFETTAMDNAKYKAKLWLRYVDDTFVLWTHGKNMLQDFLSRLNSIHPKIKFTIEIANRSQLPFADVLVIKKQDGALGQLQGVAKAPVSRFQRFTVVDHIRIEGSEIKHILRTNGFTTNTMNRAFNAKTKPMDTTTYVTKAYLI